MGMGIAATHDLALVLKDLHIVDRGPLADLLVLLGPHLYHPAHVLLRHLGQGQAVIRRKADHAAEAWLRAGHQEGAFAYGTCGRIGQERGKVVVKDVGAGIGRVVHAAGPRVARTEVAGGIVVRPLLDGVLFHLALPGALGAVGRDQDPLARQRVPTPVRVIGEGKLGHRAPSCSAQTLVRHRSGLSCPARDGISISRDRRYFNEGQGRCRPDLANGYDCAILRSD